MKSRMIVALLAAAAASAAYAIDASDRYRSPRNAERAVRRSTDLIILHTTEAPARSSLNKLSDRGEAHFCVTENGTVYRIVDRDREAFHAGRSMWNGREDVDKFSVGIECVGYHNKPMPSVQIAAVKRLVDELKRMYRLSDDRVLCHSHVAYGAPNKWHRFRHRGRKRCGMLFAMPSVRRALGLSARPAFDPDTRARRLVVGDDYLNRVLYSRTDTMAAYYKGGAAEKAKDTSWISRLFGKGGEPAVAAKGVQPKPAAAKPAQPRPAAAKPAQPKQTAAKQAQPKQAAKPQKGEPRSVADLKARGYVQKGVVSKDRTAAKIAGGKWNSPDTYYTIRDKVIPGSSINPARIENGMAVWMKARK